MKRKIYQEILIKPWAVMIMAAIAIPFVTVYMLIRHPRRCWQAWREARRHY